MKKFNPLDDYPTLTEVVEWPESQMLAEKSGFLENCALINSPHGLDIYGSSAYRVNPEWYKQFLNGELDDMPQEEQDRWDEDFQVDCNFPFDDETECDGNE